MTPEEIQRAQSLLDSYKNDLQQLGKLDQKRSEALLKLETQLKEVQNVRLTEFQNQMLEFDGIIGDINNKVEEHQKFLNDLLDERRTLMREGVEDNRELIVLADELIAGIREQIKEQERIIALTNEQIAKQKEYKGVTDTLITSFTGIKEQLFSCQSCRKHNYDGCSNRSSIG